MTDHIPSSELKPEDVPRGDLSQFAYTFNGYRHFGSTEAAQQKANEIRGHWVRMEVLPEDVDDLRACLFVEYRRERFVEFDDAARITAPDGTVLHDPDPSTETPARAEQERYKRALADRIADRLRRRDESSGGMDTSAIRARLRGHRVEAHPDYTLSISSAVLRAEVDGVLVVAVGNDHPLGTQITGMLDGLHLWLERYRGEGPLRYVVGRREDEREMAELTAALGSLRAGLPGVDVSIQIDFQPTDLRPADFSQARPEWADLIAKRDALLAEPPELVRQLSSIVDDPSFRWYMSVHAPHYSGRIDGLQVCTVARDGASGTLKIGAAGGNEGRLVREQFREVSGGRDEVPFSPDDLLEPAGMINDLVERRRHGSLAGLKREHRLEAQVLRGAIAVHAPSGEPLPPITAVGQFPALYSPNGGARYTDVLLWQDSVPWVVELKEMVAGQGKYLRHAIAQAVLYRHFIRSAAHLHPWFASHEPPLDASACRGAIAFPGATSRRRRVEELRRLAALFDVEVLELDAPAEELPDVPPPLFEALAVREPRADYRVLVRFATAPDDPEELAGEIRPMLGSHELAIVEDGDIEISLAVFADSVFRAAQTAMDRVQSAIGESSYTSPELLSVDVEGIYAVVEDDDEEREAEANG